MVGKALTQMSFLSTAQQNPVLANWLCVQCSGCFAVCVVEAKCAGQNHLALTVLDEILRASPRGIFREAI